MARLFLARVAEAQLLELDISEGPSKDFVPRGLGACLVAVVGLCSLDRRVSAGADCSAPNKGESGALVFSPIRIQNFKNVEK